MPTRAFHWLLAGLVLVSIGSGYVGGNAMAWHLRSGYAIFALIAFRLVWGFVGGRWSRFGAFVYAPATSLRYLRGASLPGERHPVGHNPLGAWSVFALLFFLAAQVGTGLVADDEIATTGPLNRFVSNATASMATGWHKNVGQRAIVVLVLLHVGAIAFYALRLRRDLVGPMLHGDKLLAVDVPPSIDTARARLLAGAIAAACAIGVGVVVGLAG